MVKYPVKRGIWQNILNIRHIGHYLDSTNVTTGVDYPTYWTGVDYPPYWTEEDYPPYCQTKLKESKKTTGCSLKKTLSCTEYIFRFFSRIPWKHLR